MKNNIDLDYVNSRRLLLPDTKNIHLHLVGCGGTGSWLAPAVVRVAKVLKERFDKEVSVHFYDPDKVEEKNTYRQNFCAAEIGVNKAETLAQRYGLAWGIEIEAVVRKFVSFWPADNELTVIIGCVDNWQARKEIASQQPAGHVSNLGKYNIWWLDSGNSRNSGQILLGSISKNQNDPFQLEEICTWLPTPAVDHPELIEEPELEEAALDENISCAEMALRDSQGLAINQRMAAEAADYLVRMLITKDLHKFATYVDLESGTTRSKYITEKAIKGYLK